MLMFQHAGENQWVKSEKTSLTCSGVYLTVFFIEKYTQAGQATCNKLEIKHWDIWEYHRMSIRPSA